MIIYGSFKNRVLRAGEFEIYRWGRDAQAKALACKKSKDGYYSIPILTKGWAVGTSSGKYGEFAAFDGVCFSVNKGGYAFVKETSEKAEAFLRMVDYIIELMSSSTGSSVEDEKEEEEETSFEKILKKVYKK